MHDSSMSDDLNEVRLRGNLGREPELRVTGEGQAVLKLNLATNESYTDKNKQQQKRVSWHRIAVWGRDAEELGRTLMKGSRITVEGRLSTSSYEGKDGKKVWTTEVVARKVTSEGSNAPPEEREREAPRGDSAGYGQRGGRGQPARAETDIQREYDRSGDDEIPF